MLISITDNCTINPDKIECILKKVEGNPGYQPSIQPEGQILYPKDQEPFLEKTIIRTETGYEIILDSPYKEIIEKIKELKQKD